MSEKSDSNDSMMMGFGLWMSLCFVVCLWFWKSFSKGRQQFQNNLHVIEDGLRRMQEELEKKQRQDSIGCIDNMEDLSSFMEKFKEAGKETDPENQDEAVARESIQEEVEEELIENTGEVEVVCDDPELEEDKKNV